MNCSKLIKGAAAPPQQCLNAVTSYAPNNRSSSQLHTAGTGAQNNAQENKQTPNAQPAFIPPHLRGFNLLPRAHQSFTQPAPLHLQPTPVSRNASQSARIKGVPMKNDKEEQTQQYNPVNQIPVNHGMHNPTHLPPGHGIKRVSTTSAKMEEYPTAPTAEPVLEMKPPEASFLLYLNSKLTAAAAAKKKSNDHADKSFQALLVNSAAARAARYTVFAAPNAESDTVFKSFIAEKTNAPITNGRKYVLKSRQQTQQAISAVPKQGANQSSSFQTSNFIGNVPSSPRNEVGPYTAFGPGAEMKLGPMMRSVSSCTQRNIVPAPLNLAEFSVTGSRMSRMPEKLSFSLVLNLQTRAKVWMTRSATPASRQKRKRMYAPFRARTLGKSSLIGTTRRGYHPLPIGNMIGRSSMLDS